MTFLARTGLDRFNPAQGGARGMRVVAGALLVLMASLYLGARLAEPRHPGFGYLRAFAEAAMVGGLADWFAVTALFRHPLGVPIPHTAIIPRNKDRIGDTLAVFLRENFLTPGIVARRMRRIDVAAAAGRFLSAPSGDGRLREGASRLVAGVVESMDDARLGGMAKAALAAKLGALDVAPLLGQALDAAIKDGRHLPLMDAMMVWAGRTLEHNEALLREMISQKAGSILRWTGLDSKLANAILDGLRKMLTDMADDPSHPMRAKAEDGLVTLAYKLQHDAEMQTKVAQIRDEILANPAIGRWLDGLWQAARAGLLRAARDPQAALAGRLGEALRQLGRTLQSDARLARSINGFARRVAAGTVASYGDAIVKLVSETIRGWDAQTITGRLESAVGRDLQYIRINGTVVGGLVGLLIHLLDTMLRLP